MNFPEVIVGIGGAGKKLVYSILSNEWILDELLKPNTGHLNYDVYIIDTALGEWAEDTAIQNDINSKISKIQSKYIDQGHIPSNITIRYQLFTRQMNLVGTSSLMNDSIIQAIKTSTGAKFWWFGPDDLGNLIEDLNKEEQFNTLNFLGGVLRRRALGKAILYRAISQNIFRIGLNSGGRVAIIVGLGGGTGSGMFIDYAEKLKQIVPIDTTLFGIMPTSKESEKELANGYASLCELEYLRLKGQITNYFNNVILVPMEPTGYRGSINIDNTTEDLLQEFHESFVYTFLSYYNLGNFNAQLIQNVRDYAQFVVGSSCIVRYNIETNKKIMSTFKSILDAKTGALTIEEDLNGQLGQFLTMGHNQNHSLTIDDSNLLVNRLDDLKNLLETNTAIISQMGYTSVSILKNAITIAESRLPNNSTIIDKIMAINAQLRITNIPNPRNEIDIPLKNLADKELSVLKSSIELFDKINVIEGIDEKRILKDIMKKEQPSGANLQWIEDESKKLASRSAQISEEKNRLTQKHEKYKKDIENDVKGIKDTVQTEITNNIRDVKRIDDKDYKEKLKVKLDSFIGSLNVFVNSINISKKTTQVNIIDTNNISNFLKEFSESLDNIDNINSNDIMGPVENLKSCKRLIIESKKSVGIIDIILSFFGYQTSKVKERNRLRTDVKRMLEDKDSFKDVFKRESNNFVVTYKYDLGKKIDERKNKTIVDTVSKIKDKIKIKLDIELNDKQKEKIEVSIRDNIEGDLGIELVIKDAIKWSEHIDEYENGIKNKDTEIKLLEERIKFLNDLIILYQTNIKKLDTYRENIKLYNNCIGEYNEMISKGNTNDDNKNRRYIYEIEPMNRLGIVGRTDIVALIQNNPNEINHMLNNVRRDIRGKLLDTEYNGLLNRYITHGLSNMWCADSVVLFISSKNTVIPVGNINMDQNIMQLFNIANVGHQDINIGNTWDVGCSIFIAGTFLDNLESVANPTVGYSHAYFELKKRIGKLIYLHHTHLLEEGKFVSRQMVSIEDDSNKKLLTSGNTRQINQHYLTLHSECQIVDNANNKNVDNVDIEDGK